MQYGGSNYTYSNTLTGQRQYTRDDVNRQELVANYSQIANVVLDFVPENKGSAGVNFSRITLKKP